MEKDTVLLSVEEYNALRDFKINMEKGHTHVVTTGFLYFEKVYISTDEAVAEVSKINSELTKQVNELKELQKLSDASSKSKGANWLRFRKWFKF